MSDYPSDDGDRWEIDIVRRIANPAPQEPPIGADPAISVGIVDDEDDDGWYHYDPGDGRIHTHDAAEYAREHAEGVLEEYRDTALREGEWDLDAGSIHWGRLVPHGWTEEVAEGKHTDYVLREAAPQEPPTDEHSTPPVIEPVVSGPGDQCPVCLGRDRRCSICRGRGVLPGSTASTQREEVRAWIRLTADLATLRGELEETRRERDGLQRAADLRGDILGKINDAIGVGRHSPWANLPAGVDFVCKQAIAERAARKEAERQRDEAIAECEDLRVMREDAVTEAEREQASRIEAWRKAEAHKAEVVRLREALEHIRVCTSPGLVMYGGTSIVVYVTGVLKTATLAAPTQTTDGE